MGWESRYLPPDPILWQGRIDVPSNSCFFQRIQLLNLLDHKPDHAHQTTFAILGFKCDEGVARDLGRVGVADGPAAIRHRLAKLPLQNTELQCYDVGDIVCEDHDLEASQKALGEIVSLLLGKNIHPIVMGGAHDLAWGHYQGISHVYPPEMRLGMINFDAHFDLHTLHPSNRGSASTAFYQIAEANKCENRVFDYNCIGIQPAGNIQQQFEMAKKLNVNHILADELHQGLQEKCADFIDRMIDENEVIYMSLSLDVFAPAYAPGVSTIQPLGLSPWHLIPLMRQIAASGKVISYDICEHVPRYDIDHRTAKLAATLIYEIVHHHQSNLST